MFGKLLSTLQMKKFAPALAIGVIYVAVIAIPQRRSLYQLQGEVETFREGASELGEQDRHGTAKLESIAAGSRIRGEPFIEFDRERSGRD